MRVLGIFLPLIMVFIGAAFSLQAEEKSFWHRTLSGKSCGYVLRLIGTEKATQLAALAAGKEINSRKTRRTISNFTGAANIDHLTLADANVELKRWFTGFFDYPEVKVRLAKGKAALVERQAIFEFYLRKPEGDYPLRVGPLVAAPSIDNGEVFLHPVSRRPLLKFEHPKDLRAFLRKEKAEIAQIEMIEAVEDWHQAIRFEKLKKLSRALGVDCSGSACRLQGSSVSSDSLVNDLRALMSLVDTEQNLLPDADILRNVSRLARIESSGTIQGIRTGWRWTTYYPSQFFNTMHWLKGKLDKVVAPMGVMTLIMSILVLWQTAALKVAPPDPLDVKHAQFRSELSQFADASRSFDQLNGYFFQWATKNYSEAAADAVVRVISKEAPTIELALTKPDGTLDVSSLPAAKELYAVYYQLVKGGTGPFGNLTSIPVGSRMPVREETDRTFGRLQEKIKRDGSHFLMELQPPDALSLPAPIFGPPKPSTRP